MLKPQDLIKLTQKGYNQIAAQFSQTRNYLWKDLEIFNEYIKKGDKILDVGCGNGRFLDFLKDKKIEYLGIDYSENLIKQARERCPDKNFLVENFLEKREKKGEKRVKYDVIVALAVLNHIPNKKLQLKFLENLKQNLKPNGYILMTNWNLFNFKNKKNIWRSFSEFLRLGGRLTTWKSGNKSGNLFYYAFTLRKLKKLAKKVGFKVEHNFYSLKGKKSSWLKGQNLVTIFTNN